MGTIYRLEPTSRTWWIGYKGTDGKRHYESTHSSSKEDAKALLRSREGKVSRGEHVTAKMGRVKLAEALKARVDDLRMNKGEKSAAEAQARIKNHLLKFFAADTRLSTVTTGDVESYKAHRIAQGAAKNTINNEIGHLHRAFSLAIENGLLATLPKIKWFEDDSIRKGFFERDQFDAVLSHLPAHLHPPLRFAYITGWRWTTEVLALRVDRVDLQASVVRLDPGETKSKEGRTFPLTNALREILTPQIEAIEKFRRQGKIVAHLFHAPNGEPIASFRKLWIHACRAASIADRIKIKKVNGKDVEKKYPGRILHDFRRTAVRNLERAGVPRSVSMTLVGHETEAIYRRYAIVNESMQKAYVGHLDAFAAAQSSRKPAASPQMRAFKQSKRRRAH